MKRALAAGLCALAHAGAQVTVEVTPPMQVFANAVFDTARRRVVAFDSFGETWEVAGTEVLHRARSIGGGADPGRRGGTALVYDAVRRRVLLVGGNSGNTLFSDTWSWDGVQWRLLTMNPASLARCLATMAFDPLRDRVVLFGGTRFNGSSIVSLSDTWEFDGTNWLLRTPATVPGAPESAKMTFDSGRGLVVLNTHQYRSAAASTWEWNGSNWTLRSTSGTPGPRGGTAITYDATRSRIVAVGGGDQSSFSNQPGREVWEWDGTTWTLAAILPYVLRDGCGAWFDSGRGQVVVGGGSDGQATGVGDLGIQAWNGSTLTSVARATLPLNRVGAGLFPRLDGGATLFGGQTFVGSSPIVHGDTWRWDGVAWTLLSPAVSPSPRAYAATTQQLFPPRCLLFGGTMQGDDFWAFDGTSWSQLSNGPPSRSNAAMAEDRTGAVVLFGGTAGLRFLDDTWTWNGAWFQQAPLAARPPARSDHAMAFDPTRGVTVLYGGLGSGGRLADTWEWDGLQWQQRSSTIVLAYPSMHFDWTRGRLLLTGVNRLPFSGGFALPTGIPMLLEYEPGTGWQARAARPARLLWSGPEVRDWARGSLVEYDGAQMLEWTWHPAESQLIGAGCGSPEPLLTVRSRPRSGEPNCGFDLSARPLQHYLIALDATLTSTPLGAGCTALLGPAAVSWLGTTDAGGFAELRLAVPTASFLRGVQLYVQAGVIDPGSPLGFSVSRGLRLRIGD